MAALLVGCTANSGIGVAPTTTGSQPDNRPNIVLIVADDLGYSDLGAYGSEIDTPALDGLARTGVRYSQFYAHANCSPARAMLFSGMDSHVAGLGAMGGYAGPNQIGEPGYEGHLNERTVSVAELLQAAGYQTFMAGKWHLGDTAISLPSAKGFDRYFIQVKGSPPAGHFNLNGASPAARGAYIEDGVDRTGMPVATDFYSSNFYTDTLIGYLENARTSDKPFFAYLAFSAPHIPVQAPDAYIDAYKGRYDDGYDVLRQQRLSALQRIGMVRADVPATRRAPTAKPWLQLSDQERRVQARMMEVYAGAVDNLDDNVGRLVTYLHESGEFDNTVFVILSDNGAAGFSGWQSQRLLDRYNEADNTLNNLGRDGSRMFYGPGWASASSAPFYLFKRHMAEGGIRVPLIISGPPVARPGSISHALLTVRDIAPTLLELVNVRYPTETYEGRAVLAQSGRSFLSHLRGQQDSVHSATEVFGWELFKRRAVRKGRWKALLLEKPFGTGAWQLFDLATDPGEVTDLAYVAPEELAEMLTAWDQYAADNNVIISNGPLVFP
ncbi:MAG: arylsulfatase [Pseudomonadota bacterium]